MDEIFIFIVIKFLKGGVDCFLQEVDFEIEDMLYILKISFFRQEIEYEIIELFVKLLRFFYILEEEGSLKKYKYKRKKSKKSRYGSQVLFLIFLVNFMENEDYESEV